MGHPSSRRETGALTDLEAPAEDRRDPAEPAAAEQVGEVGDLDGPPRWLAEHLGDATSGGEGPGRAHPEALTDGEGVPELDLELTGTPALEAPSYVAGDREARRGGRANGDAILPTGSPTGRRGNSNIQNQPRADRAAAAGVPSPHSRGEQPGDVTGSERGRDLGR